MRLTTRTTLLSLAVASLFNVAYANTPTLSTTTVTATGNESNELDVPVATITLDHDQLQQSNAANIGDRLRGEAGVAVTNDGAWGQNIVLRGLKKESVVIMVDGQRINSAQPVGAISSFVDVGLLESVEVVKGPSSVLYGSGAMGGVVNMRTPDAKFKQQAGWDGRFSLGTSSADGGASGAVVGNYGNSNHAVTLGFAKRKAEDYTSPRGTVPLTGYDSDAILLKSKHRINADLAVKFNLQRYTSNDVWYPGSSRTGGQPGGAGIPPVLGTSTIHSPEQRRELIEVGLEGKLGAGKFSADAYKQNVYREIRAYSSRLNRDYVRNSVNFKTQGAKASYSLPITSNQVLTIGADTWRMTGDPERYQDTNAPAFNNNLRTDPFSDGEVKSTGIYIQDELTFDKTNVLAGIRFDRVAGNAAQKGTPPTSPAQTTGLSHTDDTFSWSLGAIHKVSDAFNPYFNVGQAYRAADMRERFEDSARGDGYFIVGNPQLKPEFSTSFELGSKGQMGQTTYRVAAFHSTIKDYIAGRITGTNHGSGLPIKLQENLDEVVLQGAEGSLIFPVGKLTADAAFTYLMGDNKQDNEPLFQTPPPEVRLGLSQAAQTGLRWRAQVRAVDAQNRVATKFYNGSENSTAAFTTADAFLGWGFGKTAELKSLDLDFSVTNLLDHAYHEHLTEGVSGREILMRGRSANLVLKGSF